MEGDNAELEDFPGEAGILSGGETLKISMDLKDRLEIIRTVLQIQLGL